MPRLGSSMTLSFPPFAGAVRQLVLANVVVYFVMLLLRLVNGEVYGLILAIFGLRANLVVHGWLWQLITYGFLHAGLFHILFNMLSLWFIGAYLEATQGSRWLREIFFLSVLGGGLLDIFISYVPPIQQLLHINPGTLIVGASGGIFGLLVAFAVLFGEQEFILFPLPFGIRAKYLVIVYVLIAFAQLLSGPSGTANVAHLGGALAGYLYVKFAPRRGFGFATTESIYEVRNNFYRWKRKRAGRKFEVYMRKQTGDKDFRMPDERNSTDGKWMN